MPLLLIKIIIIIWEETQFRFDNYPWKCINHFCFVFIKRNQVFDLYLYVLYVSIGSSLPIFFFAYFINKILFSFLFLIKLLLINTILAFQLSFVVIFVFFCFLLFSLWFINLNFYLLIMLSHNYALIIIKNV